MNVYKIGTRVQIVSKSHPDYNKIGYYDGFEGKVHFVRLKDGSFAEVLPNEIRSDPT